MKNYPLVTLQAEYRTKILANGFALVVISEEDAEDGFGFAGNNYVKNGCAYDFEWALEIIGEYDNYRADRSVACKEIAARGPRRDWDQPLPAGYVSPDMDM